MKFFTSLFSSPKENQEPIAKNQLQLITATLLIEVSKADFTQDETELDRIKNLLQDHFELALTEVDALIAQAQSNSDKVTSIQHMTRELNETISQQDKISIIELMWQVVYADGEKDCYEEHLMRQVSDLLYVSHEHFIKARLKAELI